MKRKMASEKTSLGFKVITDTGFRTEIKSIHSTQARLLFKDGPKTIGEPSSVYPDQDWIFPIVQHILQLRIEIENAKKKLHGLAIGCSGFYSFSENSVEKLKREYEQAFRRANTRQLNQKDKTS